MMKNKAPTNITTKIDSLPTDTVSEPSNANDGRSDKFVAESMLNSCMTPKCDKCHVKRKQWRILWKGFDRILHAIILVKIFYALLCYVFISFRVRYQFERLECILKSQGCKKRNFQKHRLY